MWEETRVPGENPRRPRGRTCKVHTGRPEPGSNPQPLHFEFFNRSRITMTAHILASVLCCLLALPGLVVRSESLPLVTCGEDSAKAAANMAVRHINQHHKHGFKFSLHEVQSSNYQQFSGGCHIDVNVKLLQTKCHFTNPKPVDQCELWQRNERGAMATCSVEFWVMWAVAKVIKHQCITRPDHTIDEMMTLCPSCPKLLSLNDQTGVGAVQQAVLRFNQKSKRHNYFTLLEVAQLTEQNIAAIGTVTWLKFALVETMCPREATHTLAACVPRCPDKAHHIYCQTAYYNSYKQVGELECETYPPKNSETLPAGAPESVCMPPFHQSAEACRCKEQLKNLELSIHHICPFPLK